jgi:hypothetical protein
MKYRAPSPLLFRSRGLRTRLVGLVCGRVDVAWWARPAVSRLLLAMGVLYAENLSNASGGLFAA